MINDDNTRASDNDHAYRDTSSYWTAQWEAFTPIIRNTIRREITTWYGPVDMISDVVIDVFTEYSVELRKTRPCSEREYEEIWAQYGRIAKRKAWSLTNREKRYRSRNSGFEDAITTDTADNQSERFEQERREYVLENARQALKPHHFQILEHFLNGRSREEIAQLMGRTKATIHNALLQITETLKRVCND